MAAIFPCSPRRSAAFAAALLAPVAAFASGSPDDTLGLAVLMIAGFNVVLYGVVTICWGLAIRWRKRPVLAILMLLLGALPFLHYGAESFRHRDAPERRAAELAALQLEAAPRVPVRVLEAPNTFDQDRDLQTLVATGVVGELVAPVFGRQANLYRRHEAWDCIDFETSVSPEAEYRRVLLARHAFRSCVSERRGDRPAQATVQFLVNDAAPHHYTGTACRVVTDPHHALELRTPAGGLLAYREAPLHPGYAFPPVLVLGPTLWKCPPWTQQDWERESAGMAVLPFVAQALGLRSPEDFPRSGDAARVAEALHRLEPFLRSQFAHDAVLALLGQWASTPEIDALISEGPIAEQAKVRILPRAADLLTDPALREHQRLLYPQLASHLPALLQACGAGPSGAGLSEPCQRLAQLSEQLQAQPPAPAPRAKRAPARGARPQR
ncbi:hypothetical protein HHL11_13380 [Ramlibacter sp. G-1-2-2]|uniref:DUF4105 domain-containing protein n=1 Tax=Ramlibacter agri TaxID=2728837 RepID=A0A848H5F3_9BURK|nr:hypothetical protein [Ramlibacter agri]NML44751.1 hypothetical protein [Ramlibacter agri]